MYFVILIHLNKINLSLIIQILDTDGISGQFGEDVLGQFVQDGLERGGLLGEEGDLGVDVGDVLLAAAGGEDGEELAVLTGFELLGFGDL